MIVASETSARTVKFLGQRSVGVGVDCGDGGAFDSELGGKYDGGGRLSRTSLRACEYDDRHETPRKATSYRRDISLVPDSVRV